MSRRSLLLMLSGGTLSVGGLYATGAFDSVTGDRPFDIGTADDDAALLGIETLAPEGNDGETVTLFELTNQFDGPLDSIGAEIVSAADGPVDPNTIEAPTGLQPGESASISAELDCSSDLDSPVEVAITATGPVQSVELTRTVQVSCTSPGRGVCAPRSPPGCIEHKVPQQSTDCSVVIDTPNQIKEQITGNITIGGAAEFRSKSQVDLALGGNAEVLEYLKVDTPSQIDLDVSSNSGVQGVVKVQTESQLKFDVSTDVGGGVCVENAGEITFSPRNADIGGEVSLTSTDQVTVDKFDNATTGPITIDAAGKVKFNGAKNTTVTGPVSVATAGQVKLDKLEGVSTGPITINSDGQVEVVSEDNSTVDGAVEVTDAGGQIKLDFAATEITGGATLANKSQIKMSLENGSSVGSAVDVDTDSQVEIDLTDSSIEDDLNVETEGQVKITLKDSQIDGTAVIESEGQVDIVLKNSSITGDLSITTPSQITVSDCSSVEGEVTPKRACE